MVKPREGGEEGKVVNKEGGEEEKVVKPREGGEEGKVMNQGKVVKKGRW